jgi:hypothetical protein
LAPSGRSTHLVDVLALELGDQLLDPARVDLGAGGLEDRGDVGSGGGGLATELEEEVSGDVLHFCVVDVEFRLDRVSVPSAIL